MTDIPDGFGPLADRPPFDADPDAVDDEDGPSPVVAQILGEVLDVGLGMEQRQELILYLIGDIAAELAEAIEEDAGLSELITRLQVSAEVLASIDLSEELEEEGEAEALEAAAA